MRTRIVALVAALALAASCTDHKQAPEAGFMLSGFPTPECVIHDPAADVYLVSCIDGDPKAKDGKASIQRIEPSGRKVDADFIRGGVAGVTLHAPKGMALAGDVLWVADIDVVRKFERATGKPLGEVAIPGASFLNDVSVAPDGAVWVTDSGMDASFQPDGNDAIHVIEPAGTVRLVARSTELGNPNGIVATATGAYVVELGAGWFSQVDFAGRRTPLTKAPSAGLDGLVRLQDGRWLASSWAGSCILAFDRQGGVRPLVEDLDKPADIGLDAVRGRLLVPLFGKGEVHVIVLGRGGS
ncbi:MAG: hypothetical protein RIT25_2139 [Planctomycetota bacterium]